MNIPTPTKTEPKKKNWWQRLMEKIDKAMLDKAKKSSSCCGPKSKDGGKCC